MMLDKILAEIDEEISRLKQVRALLSQEGNAPSTTPRRRRRTLSAAARKRIADAQRARWAKQKSEKK